MLLFAADDGFTVSEAVGARSDVEVLEFKVKSNKFRKILLTFQ
jgi:hypothetical protein